MAQNPWLVQFPVLLTSVTPVFSKNKLFFVDKGKKCLPVEDGHIPAWELVALSGGQPLTIFGEWNGQT